VLCSAPPPCLCVSQADLADRDFTAERYQPVVIGSSAHSSLAAEQSAAARAQAESRAGERGGGGLHLQQAAP